MKINVYTPVSQYQLDSSEQSDNEDGQRLQRLQPNEEYEEEESDEFLHGDNLPMSPLGASRREWTQSRPMGRANFFNGTGKPMNLRKKRLKKDLFKIPTVNKYKRAQDLGEKMYSV